MRQKRAYVDAGHVGDKQSFLELYRRANAWLRENYSNRRIDRESLEMLNHADFGEIAEARKRNARALYQGLTECSGIRFLFDQNQMDCPLFVPIVVAPSRRDKLRKTLSEASIYCPVHWPKPEDRCDSNLYDCELSLVCDQRYSEEDMERVACVVQGAFSSIG